MSSGYGTAAYLEESAKELRAAAAEISTDTYSSSSERHTMHLSVAEGFAKLAAIDNGLNPWAAPEKAAAHD